MTHYVFYHDIWTVIQYCVKRIERVLTAKRDDLCVILGVMQGEPTERFLMILMQYFASSVSHLLLF